MNYLYAVETPLEEGRWYQLCVCDTPECAAAVIQALLGAQQPPALIQVRLIPK